MVRDDWYYQTGSDVTGPVSEKILLSRIKRGKVLETDSIWRSGAEHKKKLRDIPDLKNLSASFPSLESEKSSSIENRQSEPALKKEDIQPDFSTSSHDLSEQEWELIPPHPWRRFFARMFDIYLFSFSLYFLSTLGDSLNYNPYLFLTTYHFNYILSLFSFVISAICMKFTGGTPGKWLLGIRVTDPYGKRIGMRSALKREFSVLFFGFALGIPFVSIFTLIRSYLMLEKKGDTRWDQKLDLRVSYRKKLNWKKVFIIIFFYTLIMLTFLVSFLIRLDQITSQNFNI